jgi:hypothetical protein
MNNNRISRTAMATFTLAVFCGAAVAAAPYANATVEGALAPGVYGRIEIGNAPPPPLIYAQPVIIQRPAVLVQQQPVYMRVPPGHEKKWSKHCGRYNACGHPVYFVKVDDNGRGKYKVKNKDKHHGKGHKNKHDD